MIIEWLSEAPLLDQIETLDLSLGWVKHLSRRSDLADL